MFKRSIRFALATAILFSMVPIAASAGTIPVENRQELKALEAEIRAAQFLSRATFGPTKEDIADLSAAVLALGEYEAFEAWIDDQFLAPVTNHHSLAKAMIAADGFPDPTNDRVSTSHYRQYSWWHAAISAEDQLRQRVAWALSQIFVINDFNPIFNSRRLDGAGEVRYLGVVNYYDMLLRNAFGNYRTALEDVTLHPVMGLFLSHLGNKKADPALGTFPDENYAREIQQLMTIGLYLIKANGDFVLDRNKDPIPSYDNDDIVAFSRVFTGLNYAGGSVNLHQPMEMNEALHDSDEKVLHSGTILPAREDGNQDISDALDNLFEHPNMAPFLARLLIQRMVKSNPSNRYVEAVASAFEDDGTGQRGDMKSIIKEMLLNKEAMESYSFSTQRKPLALRVTGGGTEDSRLQEPVLRYAAFIRAFDGFSTHPAGYFSIPDRSGTFNQAPYKSPSIFNFYLPNHTPGGELQSYRPKTRIPNRSIHAPEFQIMTAVSANRFANLLRADIQDAELDLNVRQYDGSGGTTRLDFKILLDFSQEIGLAADPAALMRHLNILLCHGSLSDSTSSAMTTILEQETSNPESRAEGAILALLNAPDCAIHE